MNAPLHSQAVLRPTIHYLAGPSAKIEMPDGEHFWIHLDHAREEYVLTDRVGEEVYIPDLWRGDPETIFEYILLGWMGEEEERIERALEQSGKTIASLVSQGRV